MIDRTKRHLCLRLCTVGRAAAVSFVIFSLLPLAAFICLAAGWISFTACWIPIVVLSVLGFVGVAGGVLAFIGGCVGKNGEVIGGGVVAFFVGGFLMNLLEEWRKPLVQAADSSLAACAGSGSFLFNDMFVGFRVYILSWGVLAAALLASLAVLATIGLLRLEVPLKYTFLRIGYACPDCHRKAVPHFRCPKCSSLISDLRPSPYGVLQAKCSKCGATLPTLDTLGRLSLQKVCSSSDCSRDLDDPAFGRNGEFHFAIIGATSSGKTNLMVTSVWRFEQAFAPANGLTVAFANSTEKHVYDQWVRRLMSGQVMDKTDSRYQPRAFTLTVNSAAGLGCRLYVYDAAGDDFAEEDRMAGHHFQEFIDGIIFVLDPFAEQEIRAALLAHGKGTELKKTNPAPVAAHEIVARMVSRLEGVMHVAAGGTFPIPIAVVLTKGDAGELEREIGAIRSTEQHYTGISAATQDGERQAADVRRFLAKSGLDNTLRILETRFARVGYFLTSALGRNADGGDSSAFRPRGVIAPLVWLCYYSQAMTGAATMKQICQNSWVILRRSLRGQEGQKTWMLAWGLTVCAASVLISSMWYGSALLIGKLFGK